jgi:hypothetical protein
MLLGVCSLVYGQVPFQESITGEKQCLEVRPEGIQAKLEIVAGLTDTQRVLCRVLNTASFSMPKNNIDMERNTVLIRIEQQNNHLQYAHALMYLRMGRTDVSKKLYIEMETEADIGAIALFVKTTTDRCASSDINQAVSDRLKFLQDSNYYGSSTPKMLDTLNQRRSDVEKYCLTMPRTTRTSRTDKGVEREHGSIPIAPNCSDPDCVSFFIKSVIRKNCNRRDTDEDFCSALVDFDEVLEGLLDNN